MDIGKSVGLENRSAILPTPNIPDKTPGVFGPDYSFADNVPLPGDDHSGHHAAAFRQDRPVVSLFTVRGKYHARH